MENANPIRESGAENSKRIVRSSTDLRQGVEDLWVVALLDRVRGLSAGPPLRTVWRLYGDTMGGGRGPADGGGQERTTSASSASARRPIEMNCWALIV
jgi:hypothetical protein